MKKRVFVFILSIFFLSQVIVELKANTSSGEKSSLKEGKFQSQSTYSMKTIGLIGGLSWHSTVEYYSYINQMVNDTFKNNTNPPLLLVNMNQRIIHSYQQKNQWDSIASVLTAVSLNLQASGADAIIFCANTPHKVYTQVERKLKIPILHIADATGAAVSERKIKTVGLIGTIYTMENDFISGKLSQKFGLNVLMPEEKHVREELQRIIVEELDFKILKPSSKKYIIDQIKILEKRGAEGIILGCTEFPLIIKEDDLEIPVFNTTLLHCKMAVDFILNHQFEKSLR